MVPIFETVDIQCNEFIRERNEYLAVTGCGRVLRGGSEIDIPVRIPPLVKIKGMDLSVLFSYNSPVLVDDGGKKLGAEILFPQGSVSQGAPGIVIPVEPSATRHGPLCLGFTPESELLLRHVPCNGFIHGAVLQFCPEIPQAVHIILNDPVETTFNS